ncbi:hypothetical protein ACOACO_01990 [Nocardioides sp. CPCC 205120]|uniref:hypothetical protein n=1 Tax=Nocardioides sp. CPCC 205120 TaxID=3406462 RepID=UPI003B51486B
MTRTPRPARAARPLAAAVAALALAALTACGGGSDEGATTPEPTAGEAADTCTAAGTTEDGVEDGVEDGAEDGSGSTVDPSAPPADRLQVALDGLPAVDGTTSTEGVGVVPAELPADVLPAGVDPADVASYGCAESGWFLLLRSTDVPELAEVTTDERLTAAGFAEGEAFESDTLSPLRTFVREADGVVVGFAVTDVATQDATYPSRVGLLVTPRDRLTG